MTITFDPDKFSRPPLARRQMVEGEILPQFERGSRVTPMYTERDVAGWLCISVRALEKSRERGDGPPFVMINGSPRYPENKLIAWTDRARTAAEPSEIKNRRPVQLSETNVET